MREKNIMTVLKNKERELALKYKPVFMMDLHEPFAISAIGYTLFEQTQKSDSFPKRSVAVDEKSVAFAIEYAVWFDYDIEHLYELEHVWVYVASDGSVHHAEGSFHGKYLNIVSLDTKEVPVSNQTHLVVYLQPGKHAVLPDARMVPLIPGWKESCNTTAGQAGVLIQEMFRNQIVADDQDQNKVRNYIKKKYSFEPAMEYKPFCPDDTIFMPWEQLKESIPQRVNMQLELIRRYYN